jgi:hypothetical protein
VFNNFLFFANRVDGEALTNGSVHLALTPPRGWNSYNSFSWIVSEAEFLDNAKFVSEHLLKFGYEVQFCRPSLHDCCERVIHSI